MQKQQATGEGTATAAKERVCPKCQGAMVSRKSKFGPFYGCSNYPKCTQTSKE